MKLVELYKQYGWRTSFRLFKSVSRRLGILMESFYLLEYLINEKEVANKIGKYNYANVIEVQLADLENSKQFSDDKLNLFQKRFDSKEYSCFGLKCGNELVYSTWISWKKLNYPSSFNKTRVLEPTEALLEDSFCHPDHRGKGYHSKMNLFRIQKINDSGRRKVLVLILKENIPALKVQFKSGFKIYKKISFLRIGSKVKVKEELYDDRN